MPKKYMNDFQRVQAGNWIEERKAWIVTASSPEVIARKGSDALGHRVTSTFVKSYLAETEWFERMKAEAKGPSGGDNVEKAMAITIEVLAEVFRNEDFSCEVALEGIERARTMIESKKTTTRRGQLDLIIDEQMRGGHA